MAGRAAKTNSPPYYTQRLRLSRFHKAIFSISSNLAHQLDRRRHVLLGIDLTGLQLGVSQDRPDQIKAVLAQLRGAAMAQLIGRPGVDPALGAGTPDGPAIGVGRVTVPRCPGPVALRSPLGLARRHR